MNKTFNEAKEIILSHSHVSVVASSALHTAIEMLTNPSILSGKDPIRMKLLTAFNAEEEIEIRDELDKVTEQGFTTI